MTPSLFKTQTEWVCPEEFPDLSKYDEIAIDLETWDPDLKTKGSASTRGVGDVVGIAIAVSNWVGYFPIAHKNGPNMERKKVLEWFQDVLKTDSKKIFHNAIYDMCWIRRLGLTVHGTIIDTMIMASLVDENRFRYDLSSVSYDYTGMRKNETILNQSAKEWGVDAKAEMYKLPAMYVGEYAEKDAEITLALWQELKKEIIHQDLEDIAKLEIRTFPCILDMKWNGVKVDEQQVSIIEAKLKETFKTCLDRVKDEVGFYPEVWSASSIAKVCEYLKITDFSKTEKTNKPSFTKNYLAKHKNKFIKAIATARTVDKISSTFLNSIKNYVYKGRIHADIHQLRGDQGGTVTGRLSYSHPNLQQLPNYSNIGKGIRSIFQPEEGCDWGCFDYSQQEPRLVLHYASKTPGITGLASTLEEFNVEESSDKEGADFHGIVAEMAGLDRKEAKTINLGLFYGMGKAKLQAQLGINDIEKATTLLDNYHQRVPFVKQLIKSVMNRAQKRGKVRTLLGRMCRFDMWEPRQFGMHKAMTFQQACDETGIGNIKRAYTYKALNRLIQGSAADMTKKAMADLHDEGITPMIQIHDELDISVKNDAEAKKIKYIMEHAVELSVPNKVDYEKGNNWGSIESENEIDENFF